MNTSRVGVFTHIALRRDRFENNVRGRLERSVRGIQSSSSSGFCHSVITCVFIIVVVIIIIISCSRDGYNNNDSNDRVRKY